MKTTNTAPPSPPRPKIGNSMFDAILKEDNVTVKFCGIFWNVTATETVVTSLSARTRTEEPLYVLDAGNGKTMRLVGKAYFKLLTLQ